MYTNVLEGGQTWKQNSKSLWIHILCPYNDWPVFPTLNSIWELYFWGSQISLTFFSKLILVFFDNLLCWSCMVHTIKKYYLLEASGHSAFKFLLILGGPNKLLFVAKHIQICFQKHIPHTWEIKINTFRNRNLFKNIQLFYNKASKTIVQTASRWPLRGWLHSKVQFPTLKLDVAETYCSKRWRLSEGLTISQIMSLIL